MVQGRAACLALVGDQRPRPHPSVADSKYNLALLHKKRRETDKARQLFLECEHWYCVRREGRPSIRTRVFGSEHPLVALLYSNMGKVYRSRGKAEEAREMFTKAYSIFLKVLGPDHRHTQNANTMRLK